MDIFVIEGMVGLLVRFALLVVAIFAFVISLIHPAEEYAAAGKWTKQGWTIVLGLGVLFSFIGVLPFFVDLAFMIAAFVFLADVRPALRGLRRR
ncbi:DUF2516 family protein [Nocardioides ochotonae]|uniref:DUF2516 family protein n=1 Tax=Nocardioides ochotonae TaxID=2685869 RepID=UPI00140D1F3E|nr:DUF2516 family protein [Nocardioides ochotonae]